MAREYMEKLLHQQQISDAINKAGLMIRELYFPFIGHFYACPATHLQGSYCGQWNNRKIIVTTDIGGSWFLTRTDNKWALTKNCLQEPTTEIIFEPDTS